MNTITRLKLKDIGEIVFGKLVSENKSHPNSSFAKQLSKDKILHSFDKLGYNLFTQKILIIKKFLTRLGKMKR